MISVSAWFTTWMEKQTLKLLRKFTYDDTHESERVEAFGSINRTSAAIVSGGTSPILINTDKHWNKFISDKSNLRRVAKFQLAIAGDVTTIARAGVARAGITAAGLTTLKAGSVIEAAVNVPRGGEWIDILTGWGDDPEFSEAMVSLLIRDKFARLFEKSLGSKDSPIDYYRSAYNPADLAWDILVTHGGLDSTASTANTDIDYTAWSTWKTACATANLSLSGRLAGENIREAMELIRDLTNSDISVNGSGLITFLRRVREEAIGGEQTFDRDNAADFIVKLDDSKIVNYCQVFYNYQISYNLVTNSDMELDSDWTSKHGAAEGQSDEQARRGTYSWKVTTNSPFEGIYQDVTTVVGKEYKVETYVYVTTGEARLRVGSTQIYFGVKMPSGSTVVAADTITAFANTAAGLEGRLESIRIWINQAAGTARVKCALYDSDSTNGLLIAETQEIVVAEGFSGFVIFPFKGSPTVYASTIYHLAIWTDDNIAIATEPGTPGNYRWKAEAYGAWPDPLTYDAGASERDGLMAVYNISDIPSVTVTMATDVAEWVKMSLSFVARSTTSRIIVESDEEAVSVFYVDDFELKWAGPEAFPIESFYTKEDATSQINFGKANPEVYQSSAIWHKTLASATSFADRRIESFKNPLEVVQFMAFMEGQIAELGDIIKVTNSFFSYNDKYMRIYKILDINLAAATVRLEVADFDDIAPYVPTEYTVPSGVTASSQGAGGNILNQTLRNSDYTVGGDEHSRVGQKITLTGQTLTYVRFYMYKMLTPTGTLYVRVRRVSDDGIIETSPTTLDVATLTGSSVWYEFVLTCAPSEAVYISVEFDGGLFVMVGMQMADVCDGVISLWDHPAGPWGDVPGSDLSIILAFAGAAPSATIDQDTGTHWEPNPANEVGAWIRWDMGPDKEMDGCKIYWGSEVAYRPTEYKIYSSTDDVEWLEVVHEEEAAPASAWKEYSWDKADARYFKLIVTTHGASGTKIYEAMGKIKDA